MVKTENNQIYSWGSNLLGQVIMKIFYFNFSFFRIFIRITFLIHNAYIEYKIS